jgi:ubiquinone/menaquinone biosynthesis C-methylase UbiE
MDDPLQVRAYAAAGRDGGVMAPTHLFHTVQASAAVLPGDVVLDLGCGPATQLAQIALLNPDSRFIGLDLSRKMLAVGSDYIRGLGLTNVELREGDITDLHEFAGASVDAVISSMTLHHLPTSAALARAFSEVARVLKPDGGVYLADFARLKSRRSMHYFAFQYDDRQSPSFTQDYWNSVQAAFTFNEFRALMGSLSARARAFRMAPLPFMQAIKAPDRRAADPALCARFQQLSAALPADQHADFRDIIHCFELGGMKSSMLEN